MDFVTQEEIDKAHGNSNFGAISNLDVVRFGVLKCASGYYQGYTSTRICRDLGLISPGYRVTAKGRKHLWHWFGEKNTV